MIKSKFEYDGNMDPECVPICDALNSLPGIQTFESCSGHKQGHFLIFFAVESTSCLKELLIAIQHRNGWAVEALWNKVHEIIYYCLSSPSTDLSNCEKIYQEANEIAEELQ